MVHQAYPAVMTPLAPWLITGRVLVVSYTGLFAWCCPALLLAYGLIACAGAMLVTGAG